MKKDLRNTLKRAADAAIDKIEEGCSAEELLKYTQALEIIYKQLVSEPAFRKASIKRQIVRGEALETFLQKYNALL